VATGVWQPPQAMDGEAVTGAAGDDLEFALRLADLADEISMARFEARDLLIETKPDASLVTDADQAIERELGRVIRAQRPGEGVVGEELGDASAGAGRWIIDPIDGTSNYARGVPVWGTLIAFERGGVGVLGVASAPAMGRRWWALRGTGAFADGRPIRVSEVRSLGQASATVKDEEDRAPIARAVREIQAHRGFVQHVHVAEGSLDVAIDGPVPLWDFAASRIIVEVAGGRATTRDGGAPRAGEQLVTSNGLLHEAVLGVLHKS
jgi:histidinol-phosphatase